MAWYLDFSLLAAAILWAGSNYRASSSLIIFVLLYFLGWSLAITQPMDPAPWALGSSPAVP
jgi:hypothetical protein